MKSRILFAAMMVWSTVLPVGSFQSAGCEPDGDVKFICGVVSPEDLVAVPRSEWVIASGYTADGVHLINTRDYSTTQVFPVANPRERLDKTTYASCPGPIDPAEKEKFSAHGLAVRPGQGRVHTVFLTRAALACEDDAARQRLEAAMQITETRLSVHPFTSPSRRGAGAPRQEFGMLRGTFPTVATAMSLCLLGLGAPVAAQDFSSPSLRVAAEAAAAQITIPPGPTRLPASPSRERRPASLVPLYLSLTALQALDVHSTLRAIDRGAVEANPLMSGPIGNEIGLLALKAAGTSGVLYASERIWRRSKVKAVIFMVATNAGMAWVVSHNYKAALDSSAARGRAG